MDIQRETTLMTQFLNTKSQHSNPQVLRSRLTLYTRMLSLSGYHVTLQVNIKSVTCVFCQNKADFRSGQVITLPCCQGKVCSKECFRSYVYSATGKTLRGLESVRCGTCSNCIGREVCLKHFTEWEIYTCSQAAVQTPSTSDQAATFTCEVHYDDMPESTRVPLSCAHKVCMECLQGHIESVLDAGKADLTCPVSKCPAEVSEALVRQLTPNLFSRYQKLTIESSKSSLASELEVLFICPSADCPNMIICPINIFAYTCSMCSNTYCPQCKYQVHAGQTCAEYFEFLQAEAKRKAQNEQDDKASQAFLSGPGNRKMRQCPKCKVWIERMAGCKYMSCQSPMCQGKTYFCISCGNQLQQDHGKHTCVVEGYDF